MSKKIKKKAKKNVSNSRDHKWQKSSAGLVALWSLMRTLEAYISLVAPMSTSVGINLLLLLIYSVEVRYRTGAIANRMTCYYCCAIEAC